MTSAKNIATESAEADLADDASNSTVIRLCNTIVMSATVSSLSAHMLLIIGLVIYLVWVGIKSLFSGSFKYLWPLIDRGLTSIFRKRLLRRLNFHSKIIEQTILERPADLHTVFDTSSAMTAQPWSLAFFLVKGQRSSQFTNSHYEFLYGCDGNYV